MRSEYIYFLILSVFHTNPLSTHPPSCLHLCLLFVWVWVCMGYILFENHNFHKMWRWRTVVHSTLPFDVIRHVTGPTIESTRHTQYVRRTVPDTLTQHTFIQSVLYAICNFDTNAYAIVISNFTAEKTCKRHIDVATCLHSLSVYLHIRWWAMRWPGYIYVYSILSPSCAGSFFLPLLLALFLSFLSSFLWKVRMWRSIAIDFSLVFFFSLNTFSQLPLPMSLWHRLHDLYSSRLWCESIAFSHHISLFVIYRVVVSLLPFMNNLNWVGSFRASAAQLNRNGEKFCRGSFDSYDLTAKKLFRKSSYRRSKW